MNAATKDAILAAEQTAADLETITTSASAPEIIAAARRQIEAPEIIRAAFLAIDSFWPGFFTDANALRRHLAEITTRAAVATSPLRLVPCEINAMADGSTYLAATFGQTGIVATVVRATTAGASKASEYERLFRIEICPP